MNQTSFKVKQFIQAGTPHQIVTLNLDFIAKALKDYEFKSIINSSDLVVPDGVPLLWLLKLMDGTRGSRVNGTDLVHECCRLAAQENFSVYLLGGESWVCENASKVLEKTYPGLKIAGYYSPPFNNNDKSVNNKIVEKIKSAQPDILFVGLGAPKQEKWIRKNMYAVDVPVSIGTGGSFDIIAGKYKRAPVWMQQHGFEWLFRLTQQPTYLWKRYLIEDTKIFFLFFKERMIKFIHG